MLRATALAAAAASAVAFHPGAPAQQPFRRPPLAATVERELAASLPASAMEAVPDMVECPFTKWGEPIADVAAEKAGLAPLPAFPLVRGGPTDAAVAGSAVAELAWVRAHREELRAQIKEHGAVHLKGLELTKESEGFQQFYNALGFKPCVDPLSSVAARDMVDKKAGVYEAVNKESRKNFFVGMHNEMVGVRTPAAACFVCFKPADEGGEFLLLDGRQMFRDFDTGVLDTLVSKQIQYAVAELPMGFLDKLPDPLKEVALPAAKWAAGFAVDAKVDFEVDLDWGESDYDGQRVLQVRAKTQPPVVRHPVTGVPVWFCNIHSHSQFLREEREKVYGAERFESGASRINKSDVTYGDGSRIPDEVSQQIDDLTMKNLQYVKMEHGDVVLLDNYSALHGRNVFEGTRKHAVTWFENTVE